MPASRMRVDPSTGLSTAKRTWIPRLYCALKTNHSGIDFCSSGNCIVINRTQFIEYLKDIQPINSKSGQTSDRWDAWQRSAANYSLKTESECLCDSSNPVRSFSDLFVYTHPDIKRGNLPHPSLIQKKLPRKQQQQMQLQRCTSTERKKRSYSEADTKAAFTRSHLPKQVGAVDQSRRKSTGVLPPQQQQQFQPQYYGYSTPHYSPHYSPIDYEALLPAQQQQQFDNWLVSDTGFPSDYNMGSVVDNSLGLLPSNNGNLTPLSDPMTPSSNHIATLSPTTQSPYKASDGTLQAANAMHQLLYDYDCDFLNSNNELEFNYNIYY